MHFTTAFLALLSVASAMPQPRDELVFPREESSLPPSAQVAVDDLTFAGSGCPAGTVGHQLASDLTTLTLSHNKFVAKAGKGVEASEYRKNCQLNAKIRYPQGWQFAVYKADYRGYANIPSGVTGTTKATYYFSGESDQVSSEATIDGAFNGNYVKTDRFSEDSALWSPCGDEGLLNINAEVRLTPFDSTATALLTGNTNDLKYTVTHYLQWQRC